MEFVNYFNLAFLLFNGVSGNTVIESDNVTDWGDYAYHFSYCPQGSYANTFQLKNEETKSLWGWDGSSLNSIILSCATPENPLNVTGKIIPSNEGRYGSWGVEFRCQQGFINGFQLRQQRDQGQKDDTAANNLRVFCGSLAGRIQGDGNKFGDWGSVKRCPVDHAVCGLNVQIESNEKAFRIDATAVNNVEMECCPIQTVNVEATTSGCITP